MPAWFQNIDFNAFISNSLIPFGLRLLTALAIFIIGKWVVKQMVRLIKKILLRSDLDETLVSFAGSMLNFILLLVVIIAALDQLGVDTTSLVALIGAAGLAIGLALQGSLQNFAAGVMLIFFRPFTRGDFVEVVGTSGSVEEINIFNTRLKTGDNKTVIVPNGEIFSGTITNYSHKPQRRIDMVFGIGYEDDLRKAKNILEELISADPRILKDPAPLIAVGELADSSVNFFVRPWVKTEDYWAVYFDLNEQVKLTFDAEGISIPYPQMDVHLAKDAA